MYGTSQPSNWAVRNPGPTDDPSPMKTFLKGALVVVGGMSLFAAGSRMHTNYLLMNRPEIKAPEKNGGSK